jgi:hypothetical protein
MKSLSLLLIFTASVICSNAQAKPVTQSKYEAAIQQAVEQTNSAFPFVFTVTNDTYINGKIISSKRDVEERQAEGVERITKTTTENGIVTTRYQISTGFGNVYCSNDGRSWTGPQKYECGNGEMRLYGPETPESSEYTVAEKTLNGQKVKVYHDYSVFASSEVKGRHEFRERVSVIDSQGMLISISDTEGTLGPQTVTLKREETWILNAKFKLVEAPK